MVTPLVWGWEGERAAVCPTLCPSLALPFHPCILHSIWVRKSVLVQNKVFMLQERCKKPITHDLNAGNSGAGRLENNASFSSHVIP